jgi:hypothetical protein
MAPYVKRFTSIFDPESYGKESSAGARWMEIGEAWPRIVESPWFGVGVGGVYRYEEAWDDNAQVTYLRPVSYIHNTYVLLLTHAGVMGFTTGMVMFIVFFVRARKILRLLEDPRDRATVMAATGAMGSVLLGAIMQPSLWYPPTVPCIGVVFGLVEATRYFAEKERRDASGVRMARLNTRSVGVGAQTIVGAIARTEGRSAGEDNDGAVGSGRSRGRLHQREWGTRQRSALKDGA